MHGTSYAANTYAQPDAPAKYRHGGEAFKMDETLRYRASEQVMQGNMDMARETLVDVAILRDWQLTRAEWAAAHG